jgi:alpha-tubulin suppressor-like RCC1 family protein
MKLAAEHRTAGSRRLRPALTLATIVAALIMVTAAPAQAHEPYVAAAWGQNGDGTLGNGGGPSSDVPVGVFGLSGVTAIASERGTTFYGHALALLETGTVWGWGRNNVGQVGDGTKETNRVVPVAVCAVGSTLEQCQKGAHLSGVKAIAAGNVHSLAVLATGAVVEWGSPGDGSGGLVPVAKSGLSGVKALAAGGDGRNEGTGDFSLALLENGTVMAWGAGGSGRLGNGTETSSVEPVAVCAVGEKAPCVSQLSHVKAIAAGVSWGLALLENGTVVSWGANGTGQLGNGGETGSAVPVVVCALGASSPCSEESKQLKGAKAVEAGQDQSLALLENGTVMAWGGPDLGNGTSTKSTTPVAVCAAGEKAPCANALTGATAIAAGGENPTASYALVEGGKVMAWGDGTWSELGDGSTESSLVPVTVSNLRSPKGIAAGDEQGFAFGPPGLVPLDELGRCVKLTTKTKTGGYKSGNCVTQVPEHKGAYEWEPGPGTKRGFKGKSSAPKLETFSNHVVQCTTGSFTGEWTAAKTASVKLSFAGCTTAIGGKAEPCQTNPKEASEIKTEPLEAELGVISTEGSLPTVGLDLKLPKTPSASVVTFTCGSGPPPVGEQWTVEGSAIGGITPVDAMRSIFDPLYRAVSGVQIPERFTGQPKDTLLVTRLDTSFTKSEEQAGVTMPGATKKFFELTNEEPLEIKAK